MQFKTLFTLMMALGAIEAFGKVYYTDKEAGKAYMTDATQLSQWRLDDDIVPTELPDADDYIYIRDNYSVKFDKYHAATSLAVFNQTTNIVFASENSKLEVEVGEGDEVELTPSLKPRDGVGNCGTLVKTGTGTLYLSNDCSIFKTATYRISKFDIREGVLRFIETITAFEGSSVAGVYLVDINVNTNATVVFSAVNDPVHSNNDHWTQVNKLTGYGTVSNYAGKAELRISSGCDFHGKITSPVSPFIGANFNLFGTNSTFTAQYRLMSGKGSWNSGVTGVKYFGESKKPSSIGTFSSVNFNVRGGVIKYLGEGERTTKSFSVSENNAGDFAGFDGGVCGGLELAGSIYPSGDASTKNKVIGLGGNHTNACILSGDISYAGSTTSGGFSLFKTGTGTWRLADSASLASFSSRKIDGAIKVDQGVLQFDSATRRGVPTSIGAGDRPFVPTAGAEWSTYPVVDYNFMLGTATTEGALEYTGTNAVDMTDRPFAMFGNAKLINNTDYRARFRALAPQGTGNRILTLDGASTADNKVFDITDNANAKVSVVKSGAGKWILGGNQTFSGDLVVTGGTLVVENFGPRYTWFRLQIKMNQPKAKKNDSGEYVYTDYPNNEGEFGFIGIYDENNDLMTDALEIADGMNGAAVEPGQVGYDTIADYGSGSFGYQWGADFSPTNAFSATMPQGPRQQPKAYKEKVNLYWAIKHLRKGTGNGVVKNLDNSGTWIPLVWRLKDSVTAEAHHFDVASVYGLAEAGGYVNNPRIFSMEGSVDGCHWENLNPANEDFNLTVDKCQGLKSNYTFYFANNARTSTSNCRKHTAGTNIVGRSSTTYSLLNNVGCVKVGNGATLQAAGTMVGAKALNSLELDTAANTIDGFDLAADGTLNVKTANPKAETISLNTTFANTSTLGNVTGWNIQINGAAKKRIVEIAEGKIVLRKSGMIMLLK